jgi:c-di-GMP-binding flagellar brake protein YcgR
MADGTYDMLLDAIARSAGAVVSLPAGPGLVHHKSRFLAEAPSGFWVAAPSTDHRTIAALIVSQQAAGVSFRNGHLKIVFASPVLRRDPAYRVNTAAPIDALLLSFPSEIKAVQRRTSYRVSVPPESDISARVWRIPPQAHLPARQPASNEVACEVRDLSVGGIGLTFRGAGGRPPVVSVNDRLRIELTYPAGKLLVEGRMRYPVEPVTTETVRAGIQFKMAQDSKAGRQVQAQLTRIVGELQREEVRRVRLGLCKAG